MSSLVSNVLSQTPIVGQVFSKTVPKPSTTFLTPPPPYEKAVTLPTSSKIGQLSDYMWRQGSSIILPDANNQAVATIDKKHVENVLTLIHMASEMDQAGQHQMAKDLYIMGIDRMLSSLPLESDPRLKLALEFRLAQYKEKANLDLDQNFEETMMAIANCEEITDDDAQAKSFKSRLSDMVASVTTYGIDVLKKTPIPGAVSYSVSFAFASLESVDATLHLRERTWNLAVQSVAKAMEMDRQYQIHRMVLDKVLLTCNALLQAAHQQQQNH
ncbi:hypothetical protein DM01DRAFT_1340517 [Hesseltinella vesiculosa]|uniref:MIT domain-containing protein n=1 Tax=Hesseltinella vesiculosa TaxID=101127 RepID=A0A1X2G3W4_9FUNG|nr:hypothetical protein DM01DRAFT_1340517 [Hesseltinella vesiculosa]